MKRKHFLFMLLTVIISTLLIYYYYPYKKIPAGITIDQIIVTKSAHRMEVYANNQLINTYSIAIGKNPVGPKEFEGDKKTPEGRYIIFNKNPNSAWHKNLGISYPNKTDITRNIRSGMPTGGDIKIHALQNGGFPFGRFHRWKDWTNGCIAITNEEMDDLYEHTPVGTPIIIKP